ncbi:MAG: hypothetical protein EXR86_00095 [Gammaproteobacteria bacterium]|nr:hypothetical protein [Gammaproteobacteria bacterium]
MNTDHKAPVTRRAFLYLASLVALAAGRIGKASAAAAPAAKLSEWNALLKEATEFPLFSALFGRRSRRFGWGMEIPRGPLQFKSEKAPAPLDDLERSLLIAAGLGVSGWHNGIPYSDAEAGLCTYSARFTGRTLPSAAGIGNADLFYTQDDGTYFVSTRDAASEGNWAPEKFSEAERLIATVQGHTRQLSDRRVELPRGEPHYSAHNVWNANVPGSTVFIPVANISEQVLGFLFIAAGSGYTVWDDRHGKPAGALEPYFKSGLLNPEKKYPLSYMEQYILTTSAVEMGDMGHNIALALQTIGLGGWFFSGISPFSLMGAAAGKGVPGLGFKFETNPTWGVPNPVGLEGVYQGYCPPYYKDMREAVHAFYDLKFAKGGTYDPTSPGPFRDNAVKATAVPPEPELVEAVIAIAEYIYATYGKFPGTVPTIFTRYYTQAHRLETAFYDKFYRPGSYLSSHQRNVKRWSQKPVSTT